MGLVECYHSCRSVVSPSSFPPFSTNTHTQTRISLLSPHPSNISHKPSTPQSSSTLQVRWPLQWQETKINPSVKGEREYMRVPARRRLLYWMFEDHISHLPPPLSSPNAHTFACPSSFPHSLPILLPPHLLLSSAACLLTFPPSLPMALFSTLTLNTFIISSRESSRTVLT